MREVGDIRTRIRVAVRRRRRREDDTVRRRLERRLMMQALPVWPVLLLIAACGETGSPGRPTGDAPPAPRWVGRLHMNAALSAEYTRAQNRAFERFRSGR
jgi:hypothetical protein